MKKILILFIAVLLGWQASAANALSTAIEDFFKALNKAPAAEQKAAIKKMSYGLGKQVYQLKQIDGKYFAPWEPAAKRVDWMARDAIQAANKPLTELELARTLDMTPNEVSKMLLKDQANQRKVFFKLRDGRFWISSSKLPGY